MARIEFINSVGGKMFVDESRADEYKAAGYMLAADVIDTTAVVVDTPTTRKKSTRKKKEL